MLLSATDVLASDFPNESSADDHDLDDFYGSEELVEIATGTKTQIYKAPAVANVIFASEIRKMGARDIDEILETVPGLHVSRTAYNYNPIYIFRGIHSNYNPQVLMLINGVPITNSFWGNRNLVWGGMPIESVSRVEIIRGPGSAVYGANAFAGVINIVTKNSEDIDGLEAGISAGSNNTQNVWVSFGGSQGELKYSTIFEYGQTDGSNERIEADAQTFIDNIVGTSISNAPGRLNLGLDRLDIRTELNFRNWTLRGGVQSRKNVETGLGLAEALDPEARQESLRRNIDVSYKKQIGSDLEANVVAAYFDTSQEISNNFTLFPAGADIGLGAPFPDGVIGNPELWERHERLNATFLYSGIETHKIRVGLGYHHADLCRTKEVKNFGLGPNGDPVSPGDAIVDVTDTDFIFLQERSRVNKFIFVQDVWAFANDWELTAGLRFDDYSDFGDTTNPRLALVWASSLNLSTKLLYGQAFRAPSFAGTGIEFNPVALGNPDLKPEKIETLELAFDYHLSKGFGFIWNFYCFNWTDIIQYIPDVGQSTTSAQNFGEQKGYGSEMELKWRLSDQITFSGNAAWSNTENETTQEQAAFAPQFQTYFQANYQYSSTINFNVRSSWVTGRERDIADLRETIDDYVITDLHANLQPSTLPVGFSIIIKNIFNDDAREPSLNNGVVVNVPGDLPLAGRQFLFDMRVSY